MVNSYQFEVVYHLLSMAAFQTMLVEYIQALLLLAGLLVSLQLLLTGRIEALPLLDKDFLYMQFIEHTLEGPTSGLPVPSIAA